MEKLLSFGAKEPIKSSLFLTGIPFLIFVLVCVLASTLTYKNLNVFLIGGQSVWLFSFVVLAVAFKWRAYYK